MIDKFVEVKKESELDLQDLIKFKYSYNVQLIT